MRPTNILLAAAVALAALAATSSSVVAAAPWPLFDYATAVAPLPRGRGAWFRSPLDPDVFFAFGGEAEPGSPTKFADLWRFTRSTRSWVQIRTTGSPPPPVSGFGVHIAGNRAYVFGGDTADGLSDQLYSLSLSTMRWRRYSDGIDTWAAPRGFVVTLDADASATPDPAAVPYFFSIVDRRSFARLNTAAGTVETAALVTRAPVYDCACTGYNGSHSVCFGGVESQAPWDEQATLHLVDLRTREFSLLHAAAGSAAPPNRSFGFIAKEPTTGDLIIGAGYAWRVGVMDDVWRFRVATRTWEPVLATGHGAFAATTTMTLAMVGDSSQTGLLFGGHSNAIVELNLAGAQPVATSVLPRLVAPSPRYDHAVVAIAEDMFVLFGLGADNAPVRDVAWMRSTTEPVSASWRQLVHPLPPLFGASAVAVGSSILVFFGVDANRVHRDTVLRYFPYATGDNVHEVVTTNPTQPNERPAARKHAAVGEHDGLVFVAGGTRVDGSIYDDLWVFTPHFSTWRRVTVAARPTSDPMPIITNGMLRMTREGLLFTGGFTQSGDVNFRGFFLVDNNTGVRVTHDAQITHRANASTTPERFDWIESANSYSYSAGEGVDAIPSEGFVITSIGSGGAGEWALHASVDLYPEFPDGYVQTQAMQAFPLLYRCRGVQIKDTIHMFGGWTVVETSLLSVTNAYRTARLPAICPNTSTPGLCSACADGAITPGCTSCPSGSYFKPRSGRDASACIPCPAGTYLNRSFSVGLASCKPCPEGTYQSSSGQSSCVACPAGSSCPLGSSFVRDGSDSSRSSADSFVLPASGQSSDLPSTAWIVVVAVVGFCALALAVLGAYLASTRVAPSALTDETWAAVVAAAELAQVHPEFDGLDDDEAYAFCASLAAPTTMVHPETFAVFFSRRNVFGAPRVSVELVATVLQDLVMCTESGFVLDLATLPTPPPAPWVRDESDGDSKYSAPKLAGALQALDAFPDQHRRAGDYGIIRQRKTPFGGLTTVATGLVCLSLAALLLASFLHFRVLETRAQYPTDMLFGSDEGPAPQRGDFTLAARLRGVPSAESCDCRDVTVDSSDFYVTAPWAVGCEFSQPSSCTITVSGTALDMRPTVAVPRITLRTRNAQIFAPTIDVAFSVRNGGDLETDHSGFATTMVAPPRHVFRGTSSSATLQVRTSPTLVENQLTRTSGRGYQVSRPTQLGGGAVVADRFAAESGVSVALEFAVDQRTTIRTMRTPRLETFEFLAGLVGAVSGILGLVRTLVGIVDEKLAAPVPLKEPRDGKSVKVVVMPRKQAPPTTQQSTDSELPYP